MQELLGKIKETADTIGDSGKNSVEIDSTSPPVIATNIAMFKVGDYIDLYGTFEMKVKYGRDFPFLPPGFELRIRALSSEEFSIFYPLGYCVWMELRRYNVGVKIFKSVATENESGIPYIKIWRAK